MLSLFSKIVGADIRYHEEGPGEKVQITYGRKHDPPAFESKGQFFAHSGKIEVKPGERFTPDGRFVHPQTGTEYALEIKGNLHMDSGNMGLQKLLNIIHKYGDNPLIIIAQSLNMPKRLPEMVSRENLFGDERLPAYVFPRIIRKSGGEWEKRPIYIINWKDVLEKANKHV